MFGYQNSGGGCGCGCGQILGVRYCGHYGPNPTTSGYGQYCWNGLDNLTPEIVQTYITNVNAYDMSSIAPGFMRLLQHDGNYVFEDPLPPFDGIDDPGTGALTGEFFDFQLTPEFYATAGPCSPSGLPGCAGSTGGIGADSYTVVDPFFQGNPLGSCCFDVEPRVCSLTPCSFLGANLEFEGTGPDSGAPFVLVGAGIIAVVRCEVVYASASTGAMQDFDWWSAVTEDEGGLDAFAVCMNQPAFLTKLTCTASDIGTVVNIPCPNWSQPSDAIVTAAGGDDKYFLSRYWFPGDTCDDDP